MAEARQRGSVGKMLLGLPVTRTQIIAVAALSFLLAVCFMGTMWAPVSAMTRVLTGEGATLFAVMAWSFERCPRRAKGRGTGHMSDSTIKAVAKADGAFGSGSA